MHSRDTTHHRQVDRPHTPNVQSGSQRSQFIRTTLVTVASASMISMHQHSSCTNHYMIANEGIQLRRAGYDGTSGKKVLQLYKSLG